MTLEELAVNYKKLRDLRLQREAVVKEMKKVEEQFLARIMQEISAAGLTQVRVENVGLFTPGVKQHVEMRDAEKFARYFFVRAVKLQQSGAPLSEGLALLQRSPNQGTVKALIEDGEDPANMGLELVDKPKITFTKA